MLNPGLAQLSHTTDMLRLTQRSIWTMTPEGPITVGTSHYLLSQAEWLRLEVLLVVDMPDCRLLVPMDKRRQGTPVMTLAMLAWFPFLGQPQVTLPLNDRVGPSSLRRV